MNNIERFLKTYKEIETLIFEKYNLSIDEYIDKSTSKYIQDNSYFLDTVRRLRNILSHYKNGDDLVDVSDSTINKIESIKEYIKNPPIVKDIYIPISKIVYAKEDGLILPIYKIMQEKGFSHIPILNNKNIVVGVFDGNVMTSSLLLNKDFKIENDLRFNNPYIKPFTLINNQYFNDYIFIKEKSSFEQITNIFIKNKNNKKKISMLFVTKNGLNSEPLLGLITPNDIIARK